MGIGLTKTVKKVRKLTQKTMAQTQLYKCLNSNSGTSGTLSGRQDMPWYGNSRWWNMDGTFSDTFCSDNKQIPESFSKNAADNQPWSTTTMVLRWLAPAWLCVQVFVYINVPVCVWSKSVELSVSGSCQGHIRAHWAALGCCLEVSLLAFSVPQIYANTHARMLIYSQHNSITHWDLLLSPQREQRAALGRGNLPSLPQHRAEHFSNVISH